MSDERSSLLTIGTRVTVYWPKYDQWYKGTVADEAPDDDGRFLVEYDDGDTAWMDTAQDRWRMSHKPDKFLLHDGTTQLNIQREKMAKLKIGSRLSVWWPQDKEYFTGTLVAIHDDDANTDRKLYRIHYDDGDKEWLDLLYREFKRVPAKAERLRLGSRVSVYKEEEEKYFAATVTKIKKKSNKPHRVKYDDKSMGKEWLNLCIVHFLDIETPSQSDPNAPVNSHTLKKRKPEFMRDPTEDREAKRIKIKQEEEEAKRQEETPPVCQEICSICKSIAKRPRATQCHHIFCKRCITQDEDYKEHTKCPLCGKVFSSNSPKDLVRYSPDHDSFRPVEALERTTAEVVRTYSSASAAALELPGTFSPAGIITACHSKRRDDREFRGMYWRFQGCKDRILRAGEGVKEGVAVEQVDLETGKVIEVFPSGRKAHEKTGVSRVVIKRVLQRRGKANGGGYFWRFAGETHGPWPDPEPESKTAVEQLDFETGDYLHSYPSLAEAKRAMGMRPNDAHIRQVCNGDAREGYHGQGRATAKGFFWRWKGSDAVPNHMIGVEKVIQIRKTKEGEVVKEFRTSRDAQAHFGYQCCWSTLCRHAREQEFALGYHWSYRKLRQRKSAEEALVGKRLRVQQPVDSEFEWLEGKINAFNPGTGEHEILYDSGVIKRYKLEDIHYEWKNDQGQKPVEKLDLKTGEVLATFKSATEAAASVGSPVISRIGSVCSGRYLSAHGFFWRFLGSKKLPKKPKGRRKVEQLCLKTGRVIATFDTITAAGKALGITTPGISYCCNGRNGSTSAAGFGWRFSKEDEE